MARLTSPGGSRPVQAPVVGLLLGGVVAAAAYWRRALTLDGALAASVVGGIVFGRGGLPAAGSLLTFFGSSNLLSRLGEGRKQAMPLAQAKGSRRDAWQVLANGGVATLAIALGQPDAFIGALAGASADTWATELGLLTSHAPRLITTLREVPAGTSGGITPVGLAASLGGAVIVGSSWAWLTGHRRAVLVAGVAGMSASLADSLLGATVQALYHCPRCDLVTETPIHGACGQPTALVRGSARITNDVVNVLATLVGAALGLLLRTPNAAKHVRGGANVRRRVGWGRVLSVAPQ
ncbi:MAG TPA: DUF92 domain-containing protein [Chloroflexota bacterium]